MGMKDAADAVFARFGLPVVFEREGEEIPLPCLLKEVSGGGGEDYLHTVIGMEPAVGGRAVYLCTGPWGKLDMGACYRARWREREYLVSALAGRTPREDGFLHFTCLLTPAEDEEKWEH